MAHLEIRLLGPFQVLLNGESVTGFDSDKVRALLAYLAVESDRPIRREKLAGLLWPDFAESSARTNLRQALTNLRRVLRDQEADPPFLIPTRQAIQFNQSSDHTLDVHTFTALVTGEQGRAPAIEDLEQAVALYQGEFLQGFSLPDAATFEEWALVTHESLQRQALRALHYLAGFYEEQSVYEQALRFAFRQLEIDRYQEAAHQQIMRLLSQSGQRNEALAHYEDYRQLLQTELGVTPLEQTQTMYEQIQAGDLPGPAAATVILRREPRDVGISPFRGLAAFREEDAQFFFGREDFTARLDEALQSGTPVSVTVGPSGSGKSSAVFSGLLPKLRAQNDWLIVQCRPRSQPFQSLARALLPVLEPDLSKTDQLIESEKLAGALEEGSLSLYNLILDALGAQTAYKRFLLVIDQFEELYTLCSEPDIRRSFLDVLLAACEAGASQRLTPFILLVTLRADFMSQALVYRPFADALQNSALILGPMNRSELRAAIEKPAEKQGAAFEAGLVERILDDVGEEPGNLPLLEFALTLLWERLDQGWLTHQAYEDIGRVQGALARYADEAYAALNPSEQAQARRALIQLVQPGEGTEDTRRVATRSEFGEDTWLLIQHLADRRLVVTGSDETGQDRAEVVHEALIRGWGGLQGWMAEDRAFRLWQERLRTALRGWEESARDSGALLRGAPLIEAENWLNERADELSPMEQAYIQAGLYERSRGEEAARAQQTRERDLEQAALQRLRIIVAVLVIASILGIALSIGIFNQSRIASRTAKENVVIANTAQAASTQAIDQQRIAEQQAEARATQQAIAEAEAQARATQQAIAESEAEARATQQAIAERNESEARSLALAASSQLALNAGENDLAIALAMEANQMEAPPAQAQLALADTAYPPGTRLLLEGHDANRIYSLSLSPDADRALSGAIDRSAILWDVQSGLPLRRFGGFRGSVTNVHYPPTGNVAILGILDGSVRFIDIETGKELKRFLLQPPFIGVALSPDRQSALWVNDAGQLISIDLNSQQIIREFGQGDEDDNSDAVTALAHHPDQALAMTGHVDGHLTLWNLESGLEVRQLEGASAAIEDMAFTPDGQQVLSADANGEVTAWDINTGDLLWRYEPVTIEEKVFRLAILPGGDRAIFGTLGGGLIIWDLVTGMETDRYAGTENGQGHSGWISALDVSADGKLALSGGTDGKLVLWDLETSVIKNTIEGIESRAVGTPLLSLDLNSNGKTALAGYENGVIIHWDLESGERLESYSEGIWNVESIAFENGDRSAIAVTSDGRLNRWNLENGNISTLFERAPAQFVYTDLSEDGQTMITAIRQELISPDDPVIENAKSEDIYILDTTSGQVLQQLTGGHDGLVSSVALSPDKRWAISGDAQGLITLWDLQDTAVIRNQFPHGDFVLDLAFSPDGSQALSSSTDAGMILWDIPSGQVLHRYSVVLNAEAVAFSPDGQKIYAGLSNGDIQVWDIETGEEIDLYAEHTNIIWDFELSEDGRMALSSSEDGSVRVWDLTSGASADQLDWPSYQFGATVSPDGKRALTGGGGDLLYWDMETLEVLKRLEGNNQPIFDIAFSPDGRRAVSTSGDPFVVDPASMIYWDLETGQAIRQLDWETQLYHVAITPDGRYAVTSGNITPESPTMFLWDLETGEVIDRFQTGPESLTVAGVALSPDGKKVLGGLLDDPLERDWVRLWDFETGEMLDSFVGHEFSVIDLDFLPDGKKAISVSWDRNLILWDLENGELVSRMTGQNSDLFSVAVDPSGRFALAGSGDGHLILWDLETGETIRNYQAHEAPVSHISFTPDGNLAVSSALDGAVHIWRVDRTLDELLQWVQENRLSRELTCDERALYQVDPLCE